MPDFVPFRKNVDLRDKPRKLTNDEITQITEKLPLLENIPTEHAQFIANQIAKVVRQQLKKVKIAPSKASRLVELLILGHQRALIAPGCAKGFEVSSTITSNIMQMALDSFKVTGGVSSQTATIPAIERLISASKTRVGTVVNVAFKKINGRRITIGEARKLYGSFVTTSVTSLLETLDVGNAYNIRSVPVPKFLTYDEAQKEEWSRIALLLSPLENNTIYRIVLRLKFDPIKLVKSQVTLRKIVALLKVVNGTENLHFIQSSHTMGIIDIYVPSVNVVSDRIKLLTFFSKLSSVIVSNIPSILNYVVQDIPLFTFVKKSVYLSDRKLWKISLDKTKCKHNGVTVEDFAFLFRELKWWHRFNVTPEQKSANLCLQRESKIYVAVPEEFGAESPGAVIDNIIKYQREILYKKWETEKRDLQTPMRSRIIDASTIVTAVLELAKNSKPNLNLIYDHPLVDFRYTYSNDIHEICSLFGINAARSRLVYALNSALKGDVDLRQLNLAADAICNNKKLLGLTFNGASERLGPWSKALFETPVDSLITGALVGAEETNEGVFASYTIGDEIKCGTGSVLISSDTAGAHQFNDRFYADEENGEIELTDFVDENNELLAELNSSARKFNAVPYSVAIQPHRYSSRRRVLGKDSNSSRAFTPKIIPQFNSFYGCKTDFDFTILFVPSLQYLEERESVAIVGSTLDVDNYVQLFFTQGSNVTLRVPRNYTRQKSSSLSYKKSSISYVEVLKSGKMPFLSLERRKVSPMTTFNYLQSYA